MADIAADVKPMADVDTATTDSSTEEINIDTGNFEDDFVSGVTGTPDEPTEASEPKASEDAPDDRSQEDSSESSESKEKPNRAEERKQQLNLEIRDKVAERNALIDEIAELARQKYDLQSAKDIPTVEELLDQTNPGTGDYFTRAEAENYRLNQRLDAMEKQREFESYVERVADNQMQLSSEANQVIKDFPIFDPDSEAYDADLTAEADAIMKAQLIMDEQTGQIVGSRVSPYQIYSVIAKARQSGEVGGKTSGRKSALDMMNNADVSASAKAPSSDEDNDPFTQGLLGK